MDRIKNWVARKEQELIASTEGEPEVIWKKVTLRLTPEVYEQMEYIARQTITSRSRTCEDLLSAAIAEAYVEVRANPTLASVTHGEQIGIDPEESPIEFEAAMRQLTGTADLGGK